jgi:hypothetical protein
MMMRTALRCYWLPSAMLSALVIAAAGCQTSSLSGAAGQEANSANTTNTATNTAANACRAAAEQVDAAMMAGVLDKLDQVRELDPDAAPQLLAELQGMPPQFWPAAAEQFRASLAYHQQLVARESKSQAETVRRSSAAASSTSADRPAQSAEPLTNQTTTAAADAATAESATPPAVGQSPSTPASRGQNDRQVAQASFNAAPLPVAFAHREWKELLALAADDLARTAPPAPASTAEIHQHAALRLLRLVEGDTESALEPIPQLSPVEQDYWSNQLFALATYLDHHGQPDDKRRAAAAASHLDVALAHLRDVSALTLRNLTFCKKILGYGAFEPYDPGSLAPGQYVALYVEVENYHSRSTEKGFATLLASSYEIVDDQNERVAGDVFPDVDDVCRSRRRDFHIQYGLRLPTTIKPGRYHLNLIVRDRQGDKIGSTSAAFEVTGVDSQKSRVEGRNESTKPQEADDNGNKSDS